MNDGFLKRYSLFVPALGLSLAVHLAAYYGLRAMPASRPNPPRVLEVSVTTTTPPPRPVIPPEPPQATPVPKAPPKVVDLTRPRPLEVKPPPSNATNPAPPTTEPPKVVAGLTKESFAPGSEPGAPTFGAGNTVMATPAPVAVAPSQVQPYQQPMELADVSTEPKLIRKPTLDDVLPGGYPEEAKAQNVEGVVKVKLLIDAEGTVTQAKAIKGPPLLREAAERLAGHFRYKPATFNRKPVAVWWYEDINFRILD